MNCPKCGSNLKETFIDLEEEEAVMATVGENDANCSYLECITPYKCEKGHRIYIGKGE